MTTNCPFQRTFGGLDIDPESFFGTFNAAILVSAGVLVIFFVEQCQIDLQSLQAGQILRWYPFRCEQYTRLTVYGTAHLIAGLVLKNIIPANKQIW